MRFEKDSVGGSFLVRFRPGANRPSPRPVGSERPRTQDRNVAGDSLR